MTSGRLNRQPLTTKMTNKKIYIGLTLLLILIVLLTALSIRSHRYYVNVFVSEGGWGYDILSNNKTIIHQPFMPVVNGQVTFRDKYSAEKAGRLVMKKLQNNQSPTISREELNSLCLMSLKTTKK